MCKNIFFPADWLHCLLLIHSLEVLTLHTIDTIYLAFFYRMFSVCQNCGSKTSIILRCVNGSSKLAELSSHQQSSKLHQRAKPLLYHAGIPPLISNNQTAHMMPKLDSQGHRQLNSLIDGLSLQTQSYTSSNRNQSYAERRLLGYSMEQMYEVRSMAMSNNPFFPIPSHQLECLYLECPWINENVIETFLCVMMEQYCTVSGYLVSCFLLWSFLPPNVNFKWVTWWHPLYMFSFYL